MKRSRGRANPPGLVEVAQCFTQVRVVFARLSRHARSCLCFGFGENQQKLITIGLDFCFLSARQVVIKVGSGVCQFVYAIDSQCLLDRGPSCLQVRGKVHASVKRAQELRLIAFGDELPDPRVLTRVALPRLAALFRPVSKVRARAL